MSSFFLVAAASVFSLLLALTLGFLSLKAVLSLIKVRDQG